MVSLTTAGKVDKQLLGTLEEVQFCCGGRKNESFFFRQNGIKIHIFPEFINQIFRYK